MLVGWIVLANRPTTIDEVGIVSGARLRQGLSIRDIATDLEDGGRLSLFWGVSGCRSARRDVFARIYLEMDVHSSDHENRPI